MFFLVYFATVRYIPYIPPLREVLHVTTFVAVPKYTQPEQIAGYCHGYFLFRSHAGIHG